MSECVVRMKLPEGCVWRDDKGHIKMCPLYWEDESRCQGKDGKKAPWYDGKRPYWCPIICQLPEEHGRLVDAEEMYKKSEAFCNQCRQGEHDCEKCNYIVAQGYMYKSPTIVPAAPKEENQDDGN